MNKLFFIKHIFFILNYVSVNGNSYSRTGSTNKYLKSHDESNTLFKTTEVHMHSTANIFFKLFVTNTSIHKTIQLLNIDLRRLDYNLYPLWDKSKLDDFINRGRK